MFSRIVLVTVTVALAACGGASDQQKMSAGLDSMTKADSAHAHRDSLARDTTRRDSTALVPGLATPASQKPPAP
ncbi:MAG: hypothetical protein JWO05_1425 [Gemmatimonadetes bacterium]|nr:hypothetical protein [Gemmatimonadota bacterium]